MTGAQEQALMALIAICIGKECLCDVYQQFDQKRCWRCDTLQDVARQFPTHYAEMAAALDRGRKRP